MSDSAAPSTAFWDLVDVLGGTPEPDGLERLVDALAALDEARIVAFADDLARAASALDTPQHMAQDVRDVSEPQHDGYTPPPMSSDVFLYARLAVVAAGRATWQQVVDEPARMAGTWHVADAEWLLGVAEQAWGRVSEYAWDHEPAVDLESGTSPAWGDQGVRARIAAHLAERGVDPSEQEQRPPWVWVGFSYGIKASPRHNAFETRTYRLVRAVADDPAWQAWWAGTTAEELRLMPYYVRSDDDGAPPGEHRVRRGRKVVTVDHAGDADPLQGDDEAALVALATDEVRTMLEAARTTLKLPPLPPLPELEPAPEEGGLVPRGPMDDLLDSLGDGDAGSPPWELLLGELRARSGGGPNPVADQVAAFVASLAGSDDDDADADADDTEDTEDEGGGGGRHRGPGDARRRRR